MQQRILYLKILNIPSICINTQKKILIYRYNLHTNIPQVLLYLCHYFPKSFKKEYVRLLESYKSSRGISLLAFTQSCHNFHLSHIHPFECSKVNYGAGIVLSCTSIFSRDLYRSLEFIGLTKRNTKTSSLIIYWFLCNYRKRLFVVSFSKIQLSLDLNVCF